MCLYSKQMLSESYLLSSLLLFVNTLHHLKADFEHTHKQSPLAS